MILVRSFPSLNDADRLLLERRVGAPVRLASCLLVTGLPAREAERLGGRDGAAVVERRTDLPEAFHGAPSLLPLELDGHHFAFDGRSWVLGIVNVTPDSFSDGGQHFSTDAAIEHGLRLIADGADWLDVGGESTRPGAKAVGAEEECERVVPVIEGLRRRAPGTPLSIDTSKAAVAEAALRAGASLVNDVTAFSDPGMGAVVAKAKAAACLMHMQGTPRTMQLEPRYLDVVEEVAASLDAAVNRAVAAGVPRARLLIDPGIGFGKTVEHNWLLLRHLEAFRALGCPVMVGTSRKSFLGKVTGREPGRRVAASVATAAITSAAGTAQVLRVHDVAETRDAVLVAHALRTAREGGDRS